MVVVVVVLLLGGGGGGDDGKVAEHPTPRPTTLNPFSNSSTLPHRILASVEIDRGRRLALLPLPLP